MNRSNAGANTNTVQIIIDVLLVLAAFAITVAFFGDTVGQNTLGKLAVLAGVFVLIYVLSNKEAYLYNVTMFCYLDRVFKKVTRSFLVATVATAAVMFFLADNANTKQFYLIFIGLTYITVIIRVLLYKPFTRAVNRSKAPRTLFVGKKGAFDKFIYFLHKTSIYVEKVGYVAMDREDMEENDVYLGCLEDLEELIKEHHIDQVYIMQKEEGYLKFTQKYVDLCITMGVTVRLVVNFYKKRRADSYVSTIGTYPIITYHTITLNTTEQLIKRLMDIVGGLAGALLSSPIMLITAIAIKLDSKGPVFFNQVRVGQNGRQFKIYKFRSMYIDAEERKKELMAQNEMQGGVMFKMKDDPRVTRVGKWIRKLSIDELPQFFNVIQGTMSLVGTRPPTLDEVEKYKTNHWRRISIKPGITGMWQVSGRSDVLDFEDIVEMDVEYIDKWSIFEDIKIIFKTVGVLLKRKGAY